MDMCKFWREHGEYEYCRAKYNETYCCGMKSRCECKGYKEAIETKQSISHRSANLMGIVTESLFK